MQCRKTSLTAFDTCIVWEFSSTWWVIVMYAENWINTVTLLPSHRYHLDITVYLTFIVQSIKKKETQLECDSHTKIWLKLHWSQYLWLPHRRVIQFITPTILFSHRTAKDPRCHSTESRNTLEFPTCTLWCCWPSFRTGLAGFCPCSNSISLCWEVLIW